MLQCGEGILSIQSLLLLRQRLARLIRKRSGQRIHLKSDHRLEDGTYECGEFQTVSEEELIEEINKFVETDDEFIEYKEGEK